MIPHNNTYNAVFQIIKQRRNRVLNLRTKIGDSCPKPNPKVLLAQPQLLRGIAFCFGQTQARSQLQPLLVGFQERRSASSKSPHTVPHCLACTSAGSAAS